MARADGVALTDRPEPRKNLPVGVLPISRRSRSDRCPDLGVERAHDLLERLLKRGGVGRSPRRCLRARQTGETGQRKLRGLGIGDARKNRDRRHKVSVLNQIAPFFFGNSIGASPAYNGEQHWKKAETVN